MKPFIVLNFKAYKESTGKRAVELCKVAKLVSKKTGTRIICCPQSVDLRECTRTGVEVFAQTAEGFEAGAHTGSLIPFAIKDAGATGIMLNHAERKIKKEELISIINIARKLSLELIICAANARELKMAANLNPDYIAIEPPELIGTGISVSVAKPQVVIRAIKQVKSIADIPVLCGAGISTAKDVKRAIELGTSGVLLSSAFVMSSRPKNLLLEMALACMPSIASGK
ncbi:MAG: triose-phosphate isomerase [Candidatus Anstonellales archaeon]